MLRPALAWACSAVVVATSIAGCNLIFGLDETTVSDLAIDAADGEPADAGDGDGDGDDARPDPTGDAAPVAAADAATDHADARADAAGPAVDAATGTCTGEPGGLGIPLDPVGVPAPSLQTCLRTADGSDLLSATDDARAAPGAFLANDVDHTVDFGLLLRRGAFKSSFGWVFADELPAALTDQTKLHPILGCTTATTTACSTTTITRVDFSAFPDRPFALWIKAPRNTQACADPGAAIGYVFTSLPEASAEDAIHMLTYRSPSSPSRIYAAFEDLLTTNSDLDYANIVISMTGADYACAPP